MDNNMYKIKQHKNRRFNVSEYLKNVDVERIRLRKSIDDYLKHLKEEELIDSHKEYVFALQEMYGYELNQSFKDMKKLINFVKDKVKSKTGIKIDLEIVIIE